MIKFSDLIEKISTENNIPKGQVRKIATLFSEEIMKIIEADEKIRTPHLVGVTKTIPPQEAVDDKPYRPERKILNVRINQKNTHDDSSQ